MDKHSNIEWTDHTFNPWWGAFVSRPPAATLLTELSQCLELLLLAVVAHLEVDRPLRRALVSDRVLIDGRHRAGLHLGVALLLLFLAVVAHLEVDRPLRRALGAHGLLVAGLHRARL